MAPSRSAVLLRLLSLLARTSAFLVVALVAVTPAVTASIFLLTWFRAPGWAIFVIVIALTIAALFLAQPLADRLINEHDFRCVGCGEAAARFRWIGPARKNQRFEFRCRLCGRADENTVIGTLLSLSGPGGAQR